MNKYDFDFKRIDDVLFDVLGIVNPNDIMSLKMQIRDSLNSLIGAIESKDVIQDEKLENQKNALYRELDSIATETDLDVVLRKCVTIRYLTLLSLEVKIRPEDNYKQKSKKQARRNEIFAVSELVKSVPSIVDLMNQRNMLIKYIDSENRIINYNVISLEQLKNSSDNVDFPNMKIDINFNPKPNKFIKEYDKIFEKAGIHVYDFGGVIFSKSKNEEKNQEQITVKKKLVGIIKKDEFGKMKKYSVLMDENNKEIPSKFYTDVLFSDMLLRNAKNNFNFLGVPKEIPEDDLYKYKVVFNDDASKTVFGAIKFEDDSNVVQIQSNFFRVKSLNDAYELMREKLQQSMKEIYDNSIGDD